MSSIDSFFRRAKRPSQNRGARSSRTRATPPNGLASRNVLALRPSQIPALSVADQKPAIEAIVARLPELGC
jgi:hypothetical protein